MDRASNSLGLIHRSFPHTRGDGPVSNMVTDMAKMFSPHPWGWTVVGKYYGGTGFVFPTPVGMDRGPVPWLAAR